MVALVWKLSGNFRLPALANHGDIIFFSSPTSCPSFMAIPAAWQSESFGIVESIAFCTAGLHCSHDKRGGMGCLKIPLSEKISLCGTKQYFYLFFPIINIFSLIPNFRTVFATTAFKGENILICLNIN